MITRKEEKKGPLTGCLPMTFCSPCVMGLMWHRLVFPDRKLILTVPSIILSLLELWFPESINRRNHFSGFIKARGFLNILTITTVESPVKKQIHVLLWQHIRHGSLVFYSVFLFSYFLTAFFLVLAVTPKLQAPLSEASLIKFSIFIFIFSIKKYDARAKTKKKKNFSNVPPSFRGYVVKM